MASIGTGKTADNIFIGYGHLSGTNLTQQNLVPIASDGLHPSAFEIQRGATSLRFDGARIRLRGPAADRTLSAVEANPEAAREIDRRHSFTGTPAVELVEDLTDYAAGRFDFEFLPLSEFLTRGSEGTPRPYTALAFRGADRSTPLPSVIHEFADADPTAVGELIGGLSDGFQQYTRYNTERYITRSIQFNLLLSTVTLDSGGAHQTGFEEMMDGAKTPLLCWDFTERSIEAFHTVSPVQQDIPIIAGRVDDVRHGHVYTVLATVLRQDSSLRIPVTFLDYRNAILFDTGPLALIFDPDVSAFDARHRATRIRWGMRSNQ
jgi:hypothetical protein